MVLALMELIFWGGKANSKYIIIRYRASSKFYEQNKTGKGTMQR